jgi:hypothetical protein
VAAPCNLHTNSTSNRYQSLFIKPHIKHSAFGTLALYVLSYGRPIVERSAVLTPVAVSNLLGVKSLHFPNFLDKSQISEISNLGKFVLLCSFLGAVEWIHKSPKYLNGSFRKRTLPGKAPELEV